MTRELPLPPPLRPGARIRVVASSWAVDPERFEPGVEVLRSLGFEPVLPLDLWQRHHYLAGTDDARLAALVDAITDPEAGGIWIAQGGFGATRLLDGLDPRLLEARAPWLIGFSDVTALHGAWHRAGVATLHGPNITTLPRWGDEARDELLGCLLRGEPPILTGRLVAGDHHAEGPLLGGNLSVLTALVGTGYLPDLGGALLLLEDVDEKTYRLDRMLTQLRQSGALDGVAGFVIGQLTNCEPSRGDRMPAESIVIERLRDLGRPILAGIPLGHERSARPALLGARYRIELDGGLVPVAGEKPSRV